MNKIIKIENHITYIGNEHGEFTEIPIEHFGFDPHVGDYVEFHKNGEDFIVSKINPVDRLTGGKSSKSKVVAGILALFLGSLGIHWFYLGFTTRAIIRLIIWLIVFWTGFGFVIMAIWALVDGILLLTAKEGSKWHKDSASLELTD